MKTIGYGLVQIPIVTSYRVCCFKRTLAGGVTSAGWQQILGCTLRILLLSSWGLKSVDYSLPQTAGKLVGIYIEYGILATLLGNGIVVLVALWSNNLHLFYPALIIIPVCFVTDIAVKATCYAALFLTPKVTSFGILSLIEVWFRGLSLMYGWIVIISFIYYKRKDWKLAEVDVRPAEANLLQHSIFEKESSVRKSPFSRNSSLSQRGRRSFLLRHNPAKDETDPTSPTTDAAQMQNTNIYRDVDQLPECCERGNSLKDVESEVLLGESANMSLTRTPGLSNTGSAMNSPTWTARTENHSAMVGHNVSSSLRRSPPRYKKRGGFVPDVLRTDSNLVVSHRLEPNTSRPNSTLHAYSESTVSENTIQFSNFNNSSVEGEQVSLIPINQTQSKQKAYPLKAHHKSAVPPDLPSKPPVAKNDGNRRSLLSWIKKGEDKPAVGRNPNALDQKHVQEPVFV